MSFAMSQRPQDQAPEDDYLVSVDIHPAPDPDQQRLTFVRHETRIDFHGQVGR
jgi:hypothetical protein